MYISCSCNLRLYQHFSTLPPQIQTLPPACHGKEHGKKKQQNNEKKKKKVIMSSDTEHLSLCKDYAYKVNVQIQEISHCVL